MALTEQEQQQKAQAIAQAKREAIEAARALGGQTTKVLAMLGSLLLLLEENGFLADGSSPISENDCAIYPFNDDEFLSAVAAFAAIQQTAVTQNWTGAIAKLVSPSRVQ